MPQLRVVVDQHRGLRPLAGQRYDRARKGAALLGGQRLVAHLEQAQPIRESRFQPRQFGRYAILRGVAQRVQRRQGERPQDRGIGRQDRGDRRRYTRRHPDQGAVFDRDQLAMP